METKRASPLSGHQDATTFSPNPEKEEGEVISSDADIPDTITRALLDALQEKWTGNQLPVTMISIACVRASQLQQCLVTGREPSEGTIQATLDLISLGQESSGLVNLADKVYTVSHALECTSNIPSTAVPAQIISSRRSRNPTTDAETTYSLYTAIAKGGNICPQLTRDSILGYTTNQLTSFRMSANNIPEQLVLRRTSNEDVPVILIQFRKRVEVKDDLHVFSEEINERTVRFLLCY